MTGARSTVKIADCPGTTVRLVQVVVSEKFCTVPMMGTVCGLPAALSVTLSDAVALPLPPLAVGVKVTLMVQLESGASEAPQLFVCANSLAFAPASPIEAIVNVALPLLVSVTGREALVPTSCGRVLEPKVAGEGESVTAGRPACPTPLRGTI